MPKQCVIFDLDGTLVDSEMIGIESLVHLVPELDQPLQTLVVAFRGMRMADILAEVERRIGRKLPEDFADTYRADTSARLVTNLKPIPGVTEMLTQISLPMAVASNAPPAKMQLALSVCGLTHHFGENVFSCYDIGVWKPQPDIFLHVAQAMNYSPDQCVVIEDSEVGVAAALAAGMKVLRYGLPHESPEVTHFDQMHQLPEMLQAL